MSETQTPAPGDHRMRAMIVWGLNLASAISGVTALIAIVLAYLWRGDARGTVFADHFSKAITTFWITVIALVISAPLMLIGIGFLTALAAAVYFLVVSVLGLIKANDNRPYRS